jgi:hypothetical protein
MDAPNPTTGSKFPSEPEEPDEDALNEHVEDPGDPDGLVAAEKQHRWQHGKLASEPRVIPPYDRKRSWPLKVGVLLVVVLAVTAAYVLGYQKAHAPIAAKQQVAQNKSERKLAPVVTTTKHYDSTTHTLGLDYPQNWLVADTPDKLTVTSPEFAMTSLDGSTNGHIVLTIQNQQTSIAGYPGGGAAASIASDKLTYAHPSSVQRAQTYLSYLGYGTPNGISALFLTGDNGYQEAQNVPLADVIRGNPLVSVVFQKCAKSFCTGGTSTPITLKADSWDHAAFKAPIITTLQSLVFD